MLPELCNSGYVFESREEVAGLAKDPRTGPASRAWAELATRRAIYYIW